MSTKKPIEPIIFENKENKAMFVEDDIKQAKFINPIEFDVNTKSFEEKLYIILYKLNLNEKNDLELDEYFENIYSICHGRTEAYSNIKNHLLSLSGEYIDIHKSKIITETKQTETDSGNRKYYLIPYEESISIYTFCKNVEDFYNSDSFDIEIYNTYNSDDENGISTDNNISTNHFTAEQLSYKKMLEESISAQPNRIFYNDNINSSNI